MPFVFALHLTAILVWLNYKNAYEFWNEQRLAIDNEMRDAIPATPGGVAAADKPSVAATTASRSSLFLQLKVTDLGICLPLLTSGSVVVSIRVVLN